MRHIIWIMTILLILLISSCETIKPTPICYIEPIPKLNKIGGLTIREQNEILKQDIRSLAIWAKSIESSCGGKQ